MLRRLLFCSLLAGCTSGHSPEAPLLAVPPDAPTVAAAQPTAPGARSAHGSTEALAPIVPAAVVVFEGMCDASGAIPLDERRLAVADDEENSIRIYDADRGGAPIAVLPVTGLEETEDEIDLEAATLVGPYGLWLASHGRTKTGHFAHSRVNMILSTAPRLESPLRIVGTAYRDLLTALATEPSLERFALERAARIAPQLEGGLNLEGLTARREGGVIIGFRSPVPDGLALIVGLANPVEVVRNDATPQFDAVHQLDLGDGRGIRGLSEWHGRYLIIGGSPAYTTVSRLYTWDGKSAQTEPVAVDLSDYNPEAFFTPEGREQVMVISDDGSVDHEGTPCKRLKEDAQKRFRGLWLTLPPAGAASAR
ncbi:MAG TPA: DUF3616 domain-containing protein [Polyangiaceae bacterium]|nr:DUF3616 domain-containing protein [Polyangiaceae bacterium]